MADTADSLLHDITLLERQLHGLITQRETTGKVTKEAGQKEADIKRKLVDKKNNLRNIMAQDAQVKREPALIKNGLSLEMLSQIVVLEDKLCSNLPVFEVKPLEPEILGHLFGPAVTTCTPDDGAPNFVTHPPPPPPHPTLSDDETNSGNTPSQAASNDTLVAACTLSTYPRMHGTQDREGDPICDRFSVNVHRNGAVAAVADGCSWGRLPFEAAFSATTSFLEYLEQRLASVNTVRGAGRLLLAAVSAANKKISEGREKYEAGTTTLIGGLLLPILFPPASPRPVSTNFAPATSNNPLSSSPPSSLPRSSSWSSSGSISGSANVVLSGPNRARAGSFAERRFGATTPKWAFVFASLGDCKAFHYAHKTQEFTDITEGNRQNLTDARDPGGRLGPYLADGPDLRNLRLYCHLAEPGDVIFLVSDGVHDNLDPQQLGVAPFELKAEGTTWEEAEKIDPVRTELLKSLFRKKWLEETFIRVAQGEAVDSATILAAVTESTTTAFLSTSASTRALNIPIPSSASASYLAPCVLSPSQSSASSNSSSSSAASGDGNTTPRPKLDVKTGVDAVLKHCVNITQASRDFMENHPKQKQPHDTKAFPGKMDHATCVCIRVGNNDT